MDLTKPPTDDEDAKARAVRFENDDPFPSIPRALLSSVEILDYAQTTGMLSPFYEKHLKSASYEVHISGDVIWWDDKGRKRKQTIKRGAPLILEANSIVFVQVEPTFRLPNYIAIRFNLRITHVHRGLLLGTGPLVDPGFHGKLLIPLHNLTSTPYEIDTDEALIWIEFTKTTFRFEPTEEFAHSPRSAFFKGFPPDKRNATPEQYLRKANGGNPIQSSIPAAVTQSAESARKAEKSAANARNVTLFAVAGALLTIGLALYQIGQQFYAMVQNSQALIATVSSDAKNMAEKLTNLSTDNKALMNKTTDLTKANDKLSARVDDLGSQLQQRNATPPTPPPKRKRHAKRPHQ